MFIDPLILSLVLFLWAIPVALATVTVRSLGRLRFKQISEHLPVGGWLRAISKTFFGQQAWEGTHATLCVSYHLLVIASSLVIAPLLFPTHTVLKYGVVLTLYGSMVFLAEVLTAAHAKKLLALCTPLAIAPFTILIPATAFLFLIVKRTTRTYQHPLRTPESIRDKILEILYEAESSTRIDPQERKLVLSVANFRERRVREVMIPRPKIIALDQNSSLKEAATLFLQERYSRLPVYQDHIDHVTGILLYKDVLSAYLSDGKHPSLKALIKPVLYTPETKKIAVLLQEFRHEQIHLAIAVNEYGCTEGIITIEDILEELVGNIEDEDDIEQETLFSPLSTGGAIVDARMTIFEIEKELSIRIPTSPEYDTLGGYIYHRAGIIPPKGWRLHHDDFDLEILSSNDRSIHKVKLTPP